MSILIDGATYRFENRADGNRSLNVYGTSPAILSNVCLWGSDDDDICQQWVYEESATEDRGYLRCKGASNLYLDVYTGSGASTVVGYNAHVYTKSSTAFLEIEEISGGYIRIKSMYNDRYLTANQNSGGILLFGLDENEHFAAVGVYDLQDLQKKVTEPYLVDALSFTEAEARIIEEIRPFITGEFTVTDIKRARLSELFFNENGDRFYKIKVYFITLDEKSGAEKKTAAQMLAQATTLKEAIAVLEDGMKGTLADYTIASVTETQLMDVFPFDANSIPGEKKSGEELIAEQKQQAEQRG